MRQEHTPGMRLWILASLVACLCPSSGVDGFVVACPVKDAELFLPLNAKGEALELWLILVFSVCNFIISSIFIIMES